MEEGLNFMTKHSKFRMAQRNLSLEDVNYVLDYGTWSNRAGAIFSFLRRCDIPPDDECSPEKKRLIGTTILVSSSDFRVITVWRNPRNGWRHIQKKLERASSQRSDETFLLQYPEH